MRPPARRQSALRTPLNDVLGTEGAVRLLRELALDGVPLGVGPLAERTRLQRTSARRALTALLDTGLVDIAGGKSAPQYSLRRTHPLAPTIIHLYEMERQRVETIFDAIKQVIRQIAPPPTAAWLEGAVAAGTDEPGDPLLVRVIAPAPHLAETMSSVRTALATLEETQDITLVVSGATPADIAAQRDSDDEWDTRMRTARSLFGIPPIALLSQPAGQVTASTSPRSTSQLRRHADLDARGLDIARAIAGRLRHEPTLAARALLFVEQRMRSASPQERPELEEWSQLLRTASPARLRRFLVDPGERATRLRQTLPFLGILSPEERQAVLDDARSTNGEGAS
jgi:DNA-binding transcriptional ArsR family regulator